MGLYRRTAGARREALEPHRPERITQLLKIVGRLLNTRVRHVALPYSRVLLLALSCTEELFH
jgi:hypothetical protein